MPGFTTHYILGMKAYNDLPNCQLKRVIAKYRWLYQLGLQGPDMFFYNIPVLRHRDYRNVASYMHEHHIQDFFTTCLRNLNEIPSRQQQEQGLAYFCGYLCHYIGDSICHPYVYGRIGYNAKSPTAQPTVCMRHWKTTLTHCCCKNIKRKSRPSSTRRQPYV